MSTSSSRAAPKARSRRCDERCLPARPGGPFLSLRQEVPLPGTSCGAGGDPRDQGAGRGTLARACGARAGPGRCRDGLCARRRSERRDGLCLRRPHNGTEWRHHRPAGALGPLSAQQRHPRRPLALDRPCTPDDAGRAAGSLVVDLVTEAPGSPDWRRHLRWLNLVLFLLYPISWFAPLMRAGLLPLFGMSEISLISGLQSLWGTDVFLALLVTLFALVAPLIKTLGLALVQFGLLDRRALPALNVIGRLGMADVFLIALYITLAQGMGVGRVETAWGLYLFTGCILGSVVLGLLEKSRTAP
ncbi:paraquat-inducible protein A [Mameliella sp. CS4]|nr:paraquat-inducible protein A [Mameliella sp. CS4]